MDRIVQLRIYDSVLSLERLMPVTLISPRAEREFVESWRARAGSKKLYRFERAIIADRKSGHLGGGYKPMFVVFTAPFS